MCVKPSKIDQMLNIRLSVTMEKCIAKSLIMLVGAKIQRRKYGKLQRFPKAIAREARVETFIGRQPDIASTVPPSFPSLYSA